MTRVSCARDLDAAAARGARDLAVMQNLRCPKRPTKHKKTAKRNCEVPTLVRYINPKGLKYLTIGYLGFSY